MSAFGVAPLVIVTLVRLCDLPIAGFGQKGSPLFLLHQSKEVVEKVSGVMGTWGGLWVVLY